MSETFDFCVNEFKSSNMNSTTERVNLGIVIENLNYLDFSPPYQRGKVWKQMYFTDLFRSIFNEVPFGALHFVLKSEENDDFKYVLDGKQRLLTIKAFVGNEFSLRIKDKDGNINHVFWRDVIDPNSKWHFLHTKIMSYQVDVVNWKPRDMEQQRVLFSRVKRNTSSRGKMGKLRSPIGSSDMMDHKVPQD